MITAQDIREKTFATVRRDGYDMDVVDNFLDDLANETEEEPEPAREPEQPRRGGFFDALGIGKKEQAAQPAARPRPSIRPQRPLKERTVNFGGSDTQVILFNPKSFDEAGDLVQYLSQGRSIIMTLEGVPTDLARRLLDFLSGIAFAMQGKITPISAKTYFVTPQNVDVLGAEELAASDAAASSN